MKSDERRAIAIKVAELLGNNDAEDKISRRMRMLEIQNMRELGDLAPSTSKQVVNNRLKYDYTEERRLGSGAYGVASLVRDREGDMFVLKKVKINDKTIDSIRKEIKVLRRIEKYGCRPNLLCYVDHYVDYDTRTINIVTKPFDDATTLLEFIEFHKKNRLTIERHELLKIMRGLLDALVYLHRIGIAHTDIKPENILINRKLDVQLIDFGISCTKKCLALGTVLYRSPELIRGGGIMKEVHVLKKGDVFSLGMVFYLLANLSFPFGVANTDYPLVTENEKDENMDYPIVNAANSTSMLYTLNRFYEEIGGYVDKKKREQMKKDGKSLPINFIESRYHDSKINALIETMLTTNEDKRPMAKRCLSALNVLS